MGNNYGIVILVIFSILDIIKIILVFKIRPYKKRIVTFREVVCNYFYLCQNIVLMMMHILGKK